MHKKLAESTALDPAGLPVGQKIFRVPGGRFSGRTVALIQTSPTQIKLSYSDSPFAVWSSPYEVISDTADDAFDTRMDNAGNLYIAYVEQTTGNLAFKKLTYADGVWTAGSRILVYDGGSSSAPSLGIESSGKLWVSWSLSAAPNRYIQVKSSSDDGATWGTGPADPGTQLTTGDVIAYSKLLITSDRVHVVATYNSQSIVKRSLPIGGGPWSDEEVIATTTQTFGVDFDAAVSDDGRIAVVFNNPYFTYREYDGVNWGAIVPMADIVGQSPQVLFRGGIPVVIYLENWAGAQKIQMYTDRRSGQFTTPVPLDNRAKKFERVLVYNQAAATIVDITGAAANAATGDMLHPATSCLLRDQGDQLYLGMGKQFRYLQVLLSTLGTGGTVVLSYWDGANWRAFTPSNGAVDFGATPARVILWDDYVSIPPDWQKKSVNGYYLFWVKAEVNSAFTNGPVGTQVTSISEITKAIFRR
ncbi:hypothetical protein C3F09_10695 [candidate division GN15 bacterium]|uniref:Exo-alpha-sialidase n=1 Tax=candidate division GN15 bacterium TaxID=2072418 RepID=A0A855X316_9BACT|nr:MAG: hypothetical protein C3F09_10695 [candidate division GN15 bacterium]